MTEKQLEQIIDLRNEIEQLEKEINSIKRTKQHDKVSGSLPMHPYTPASFTVEGYNNASNIETRNKEKQTAQKILKVNSILEEIDKWLQSVDNSKIRQIITYRYCNGLTWDAVAAKMGYRYSADGCRKACKRYLEKN